jgi:uncharacterized protein YjbI with pentapeptide repeats
MVHVKRPARGRRPITASRISGFASWRRDIRESGIWLALAIVLLLGGVVVALDIGRWNHDFSNSLLAEANAVIVELLIAGVVLAIYDYRRRQSQETRDDQKELYFLRLSATPETTLRKVELIASLASRGRQPASLEHNLLKGARLNGFDLRGVNMRFCVLTGAAAVSISLVDSDLFSADFTDSCLVEADLQGANLYEANFGGALLSRANLTDADVSHADFRGAKELKCEQLTSARNWQTAYRDEALACGAPIPTYEDRSLGQKFRELYRQAGNPTDPYVLGTLIREDGTEETFVSDSENAA